MIESLICIVVTGITSSVNESTEEVYTSTPKKSYLNYTHCMPTRVTSLQDQRHDIGFDRCHDNTAPFDEKSQEC